MSTPKKRIRYRVAVVAMLVACTFALAGGVSASYGRYYPVGNWGTPGQSAFCHEGTATFVGASWIRGNDAHEIGSSNPSCDFETRAEFYPNMFLKRTWTDGRSQTWTIPWELTQTRCYLVGVNDPRRHTGPDNTDIFDCRFGD